MLVFNIEKGRWHAYPEPPVTPDDESVTFRNESREKTCVISFAKPALFYGVSEIKVPPEQEVTLRAQFNGESTKYRVATAAQTSRTGSGPGTIPPGAY